VTKETFCTFYQVTALTTLSEKVCVGKNEFSGKVACGFNT